MGDLVGKCTQRVTVSYSNPAQSIDARLMNRSFMNVHVGHEVMGRSLKKRKGTCRCMSGKQDRIYVYFETPFGVLSSPPPVLSGLPPPPPPEPEVPPPPVEDLSLTAASSYARLLRMPSIIDCGSAYAEAKRDLVRANLPLCLHVEAKYRSSRVYLARSYLAG